MLPNYNLVEAGAEASVYARAFGRKMIAQLSESKVKNGKLYRLLEDGTELIATRAHKQYRLTITTPVRAQAQQTTESSLWIPRGFVLYPASSVSTSGWGTPVVRSGAPDPLNADSLAPGLDVSRWTAGGVLGEVLLTKQVENGYPKPRLEIAPAFFSVDESPTMESNDGVSFVASKKPYKTPALQSGWSAYRIEFTDFSTAGGEGDGGSRQQVFRWAVGDTQYLPPIRGYYDAAARLARYAVSADFSGLRMDDGALTKAHAGYATAAQRLNKDGAADAAAHDSASKATNAIAAADDAATGAHLLDSTFTPARTSILVALKNGMTALAATERAQWIAYGNRYWIADDPAIPVVTWDGFPSWNWPVSISLGAHVGGNFVDLDYYTVHVRGENRKLFSKRVCANGRELGTLPDWVLSAGVQTTADSTTSIVTDRLIVLCWRLSDQGTYDPLYTPPPSGDGGEYSRVLRVYYLDIPRRNGLSLMPDAAAIGLYDATTNPSGWHYAGVIDLWPVAGWFPAIFFSGMMQPPQFKGDGTAAVFLQAAFNRTDASLDDISPWEVELSGIGDGLISYSVVNSATAGHTPGPHQFGMFCSGVDYIAKSAMLNIVSVTYAGVDKDGDGLHYLDSVVRWSGVPHSPVYADPSDVWYPTEYVTHDGYQGYAVYTLDPNTGAFVVLHKKYGAPGGAFRVYYAKGGGTPQMAQYADTAGFSAGNSFAGIYLGNGSPALTSFARDRDGNYIAGYELAPGGTFEGSFFDSTLDDLAALTQTPGSDLRYFPIGVV